MFKTHRILVIVAALLAMALMAAPAFAQDATPTPDPTGTPTPEATASPTPEATETPTPEASVTPTPEATGTPDATETPEASVTPTPEVSQDNQNSATGSDDEHRPGSIMGRGLFGNVAAVGTTSLTVSTKQGTVTLDVNDATKISKPPQGQVTLADIVVGDRVAVLMDATPASDGGNPPTFSGVTAISIHVIPSHPELSHAYAVIDRACNASGDGTMTVTLPNGDSLTLTCNGNTDQAGTDTILLTRKQGDGKPDKVERSTHLDQIRQRLQDLKTKVSDARAAMIQRIQDQQDAATTQRLQRVESKVSDAVRTRIEQARTRIEDAMNQRRQALLGNAGSGSNQSGNGTQGGDTNTGSSRGRQGD